MPYSETKYRPSPANLEVVLVAEPDVLARVVLAEYLRECGFEVIEAGSAPDVLTVLRSGQKIDILLLNSQLSDGSGFSLAREVRENYPRIDIVLTFGIARSAEKAGEICDEGPLDRPYHPQEVVRRIQGMRRGRKPPSD
jgi:DNA-binding response OmpR family regulator